MLLNKINNLEKSVRTIDEIEPEKFAQVAVLCLKTYYRYATLRFFPNRKIFKMIGFSATQE